MVNTHDDTNPPFVEQQVSSRNECYEDDDDELEGKTVSYNSVEPDQVADGIIEAPNFGSVSVVDSTNVHFGNKLYYQGPVTVLKQTIVSSSEANKTEQPNIENNESLSREETNRKAIDKVRLALCPGLKKRQLILAATGVTALFAVLTVCLSTLVSPGNNSDKDSATGIGTLSNSLGNTDDGTIYDIYRNQINGTNDFLDTENVRIRERTQWLAQPPVAAVNDLKTPVPYVIIQHSASEGCTTTAECIGRVRNIQMLHIEFRHWSDIGYNFLVGGEGAVYEGRGWDKEGAHSLGYNKKSIGICVIGTFTTIDPSPKQLAATQKLIRRGVLLGKIVADYKLLAHNQVQSTESPGRRMFAIMQKWPHWQNTSSFTDGL